MAQIIRQTNFYPKNHHAIKSIRRALFFFGGGEYMWPGKNIMIDYWGDTSKFPRCVNLFDGTIFRKFSDFII